MNDFYSPPTSYVVDRATSSRAGWGRVVFALLISSFLALFVGWFVAPLLLNLVALSSGMLRSHDPVFLIGDLLLTGAGVALSCKLATWIAPGRPYVLSLAIAAVCSLVFLYAVGGPLGMAKQSYPMWYELFPIDWIGGLLVAFMTSRRSGVAASEPNVA